MPEVLTEPDDQDRSISQGSQGSQDDSKIGLPTPPLKSQKDLVIRNPDESQPVKMDSVATQGLVGEAKAAFDSYTSSDNYKSNTASSFDAAVSADEQRSSINSVGSLAPHDKEPILENTDSNTSALSTSKSTPRVKGPKLGKEFAALYRGEDVREVILKNLGSFIG